jgi:glutamine cyclotransferase
MMTKDLCIYFGLIILFFCSCRPEVKKENEVQLHEEEKTLPLIPYKIITSHHHDTTLYTQGLLIYDKKIYESTGSPASIRFTRSLVGVLDTGSGKLLVKAEIDRNTYFGEGIAVVNDKLYQLTWQNKKGFVYDVRSFKRISEFTFESKEGWGLTTNGKELIMSDGTDQLSFIDPASMKVIKKLSVSNMGYPENYLNELEYVNGSIYANVYLKKYIVRINSETGKVEGMIDLSSLVNSLQLHYPRADVLNGIAFDPLTKKLLITGKLWPRIYEIELTGGM